MYRSLVRRGEDAIREGRDGGARELLTAWAISAISCLSLIGCSNPPRSPGIVIIARAIDTLRVTPAKELTIQNLDAQKDGENYFVTWITKGYYGNDPMPNWRLWFGAPGRATIQLANKQYLDVCLLAAGPKITVCAISMRSLERYLSNDGGVTWTMSEEFEAPRGILLKSINCTSDHGREFLVLVSTRHWDADAETPAIGPGIYVADLTEAAATLHRAADLPYLEDEQQKPVLEAQRGRYRITTMLTAMRSQFPNQRPIAPSHDVLGVRPLVLESGAIDRGWTDITPLLLRNHKVFDPGSQVAPIKEKGGDGLILYAESPIAYVGRSLRQSRPVATPEIRALTNNLYANPAIVSCLVGDRRIVAWVDKRNQEEGGLFDQFLKESRPINNDVYVALADDLTRNKPGASLQLTEQSPIVTALALRSDQNEALIAIGLQSAPQTPKGMRGTPFVVLYSLTTARDDGDRDAPRREVQSQVRKLLPQIIREEVAAVLRPLTALGCSPWRRSVGDSLSVRS